MSHQLLSNVNLGPKAKPDENHLFHDWVSQTVCLKEHVASGTLISFYEKL